MPCPDSACTTQHRSDPTPDDEGRWQCPTRGTWFYHCASCTGNRMHWWPSRAARDIAGGDTQRYVHQLGWLCTINGTRLHPRNCECGQPAHSTASACRLNNPAVLGTCSACSSENSELRPDGWCSDCSQWTNMDCPAECTTDHPAPRPANIYNSSGGHEFTCPETGTTFQWCEGCDEWLIRTDTSNHRYIGGYWYRHPSRHDFNRCRDCDNYYDTNDYSSCPECSYDDEDDYEETSESRRGEAVVTCRTCNTQNTIFNEITETFVCECAAAVLREQKVPLKVLAA